MTVSRRGFLVVGSIAAITLGLDVPAFAVTPYEIMRSRWRDLLTGVGFDPRVEPFTSALADVGDSATGYLDDMTPGGAALWADLPIGAKSANITTCCTRLRTIALAWAQPGTGHTGSATTATAVVDGLRWMLDNAYTATGGEPGNWWDWRIGAPQRLLDICCLLSVPAAELADTLAAVDHHVPVSLLSAYEENSTGANRVDLCQVIALRGVLGQDPTSIAAARDGLSPVFPTVLLGDGFHADGSFIQHDRVPYAGGYGAVLLGGLTKVMSLLGSTTWAVTDPNRQVLFDSVESSFAPFIHNGLMVDSVSGRGIARQDQDDHKRGHNVMASTLLLATTGLATVAEAGRWRSLVKGWITRETYAPYLDHMPVPDLARAVGLLADGSVPTGASPSSSRVFGSMDRAVHHRPQWAFAVSMHSARTTFYETGNGENLRGWHTGSGMTYWWGQDYGLGQYSDAFWPTVDPYRLPGVTASRKPLADEAGGTWNKTPPTNVWAGGASDGVVSAVGQHVTGLESTLTGRKSWFPLDDAVVCLGAGITATDGAVVESVVDNRNLGAAGTHALVVNGVAQPTSLPWNQQFTGAQWASIAGFGGYVFLGGATVTADRAARTGSWHDIDSGGSSGSITRRYLGLYYDHGTNPTNASYAYLLLPGATAVTTAARSASPGVTVVANTSSVQGITAGSVRAANFFAAGACGSITADAPCSVLARQDGSALSVAVADPSRTSPTVTITLPDTGFTTASADPGVTVLRTSPTTKLLVEVGGTLGASRVVRLGTGPTITPATASTVQAAADSHVRDGSPTQNYGTAPLLVKTASTNFNRRAFLRFDLTLPTAPRRAVLWLHGKVSDGENLHSTVTAHRLTGTWTETGVTWNNQPTLGPALSTARISRAADWIGLDVTAALSTNPGVLHLGLSGGPFGVQLDSREATANRPVLEIIT
ncbi:polysaccharide lyase family 8 super-sandwich domain-containing protein [Actinokineospora auranticolor]|uniref:Hyaluronate lyase n=1 Tax=Actinokineospora auranticolor TaxID=155976 RepID=A0A2S6H1V2_9PSEU|nr:polysaccharide lyase family 8 super-sandwich domain-containing protein [Actinokineospora auranticolor]PPK71452.1 hyaluronate lyase [Actinokineospora auranticolor]